MTDLSAFSKYIGYANAKTLLSDRAMALMMDAEDEADQRTRLEMLRYEAETRLHMPRETVERWIQETGQRYIADPSGFREAAMRQPETPSPVDPFLACFKTLDTFSEEEAKWLVPGWIPEGQITIMAADGGTGKTSAWVDIIAGCSSGRPCLLDPPGFRRESQKVAFLTTEDSVRKKLRKKIREAGAEMRNIITPDFLSDKEGLLRGLKFGSPEMETFLRHFKPALCIFDPVQGFVPPEINMGSRNAMRDCLASLVTLGEECSTTSLIVVHTNKRKGAFGRDRIADSADLWDIARSVIMMGYTQDQGIRYLSNEKNNYAQLHETLLYSIDSSGLPQREGTSWKRDREYQLETAQATAKPKREDCKEFIVATLEEAGRSMPSTELEDKLTAAGYSYATFKRARQTLKDEGRIKTHATGTRADRTWHTQLLAPELPKMEELPTDTPVPFELSGQALEGCQLSE